jgi:ubiquinone/menaquinone biosynthesis C-methylase UbiE
LVQQRALALLDLRADDVLLDVACGTGAAVRDGAALVKRATGFDVSAGMIEQARSFASGVANVEFVEGDISAALPFADGEFTALLCSTVFHHFPRPRAALAEFARVLAPGGRLVIADGNRRHPAVFTLDLVLRRAQKSHVGVRSPQWIARNLRAAGLAGTSVTTIWLGAYAFTKAQRP